MFSLRDFFHLPQLNGLIERITRGEPGLTVVAGLDARPGLGPTADGTTGLLPSGRSAIVSILIDQILTQQPRAKCLVVAQDSYAMRVPRQFRQRMQVLTVNPPFHYASRIETALEERPGLLVLDHLDRETVNLALDAAQQGLFVLAHLDTVFHGPEVARHLLALGAAADRLPALRWVLSVQRLPTLCPKCKSLNPPDPGQIVRLQKHALLHSDQPDLEDLVSAFSDLQALQVFRSDGCPNCRDSGRYGEVVVFDVFHNPPETVETADLFARPSLLPIEAYIGRLVLSGHLDLEDFLDFEAERVRRLGYALLAREGKLAEMLASNDRKLAELEAANQVLQHRTRSLVSLQEIGQELLTSEDLKVLANRVCRFAQDLCGADRVILYYLHSEQEAEALAAGGWEADRVPERCDPSPLFNWVGMPFAESGTEPVAYNGWPPGIPPRHPDIEGAKLNSGLYVPLVAQEKRVGFILAHTTRRPAFTQKDTSLMQTLAQQAALGIQRARLVDDLRNKIVALENAQKELAKKERLESELELARQVQQSMLPRQFPKIPNIQFAARNEPAHQVGGDFYDVIQLDENHLGIAIADVSDKGMAAALYMALTRSLLRAEAGRQASPQAVLHNVNQLLLELGDGKSFVTLFYGVINLKSRRMSYSRAGHDRPLLLRNGQVRTLGGDGTPLGILRDEFRLSKEEIQMKPGDRLILYTDGLTDVTGPDGSLFSLAQLMTLLERIASQSLSNLCEALFDGLITYQGEAEQFDDMSLLMVEIE